MRFEELAYRVNGLPVTAALHPRLTVVGPLHSRARSGWIERALGVLLGAPSGDGVGLVYADHTGRRIRLERDHHGAARIIDVATGGDATPAAADLPLDGRFDWFAPSGLDGPSARALMRVVASDFKGEDFDPWAAEDELVEARTALAEVLAQHEDLLARLQQVDELYRSIAEIDQALRWLQEQRTLRLHAKALEVVRQLEADVEPLRRAVATERAAANAIFEALAAGDEWLKAAGSLEVARLAIGRLPAPAGALPPAEDEVPVGEVPMSELELAHRDVEMAERQLDRSRLPGLAVAARRRLTRAQRRELAALAELGFGSWLAYQLDRVDQLLAADQEARADRAAAELAAAATPADIAPTADAAAAEPDERMDPAQEARLRHALAEAESAYQAAEVRLEALLSAARVLPQTAVPRDLAVALTALSSQAARAARRRQDPPTGADLRDVEDELAEARRVLASHELHLAPGGTPPDHRGDNPPVLSEEPLPDPEPLLEERAGLFEAAYRIERRIPDPGPIEERREELTRRIAFLEAGARAGYQLKSLDEAETVLLHRVARAYRFGPHAEPIPLFIDDAFAGFELADRHDLLHLLTRLSEAVQIVYCTEDPDTLAWAEGLAGEGEALVVLPPAVASVA